MRLEQIVNGIDTLGGVALFGEALIELLKGDVPLRFSDFQRRSRPSSMVRFSLLKSREAGRSAILDLFKGHAIFIVIDGSELQLGSIGAESWQVVFLALQLLLFALVGQRHRFRNRRPGTGLRSSWSGWCGLDHPYRSHRITHGRYSPALRSLGRCRPKGLHPNLLMISSTCDGLSKNLLLVNVCI